MECFYPRYTYNKPFQGKRELIRIPCGRCIGCRLERSRQWAVRIMAESTLHDLNSFITLTYNDENLPADGSLCKAHFQNFMKKYRHYVEPNKIRFFACGEYGDKGGRPHYHACILGHDFDDKEVLFKEYKSKNNFSKKEPNTLYKSPTLEKLWNKGFCTIGNLTIDSAGYVARYCTKKITGKKAKKHYNGRLPEFALMSRRPGLAHDWFEKYHNDFYPKDFCTINGNKHKPPKYFDRLLCRKNFEMYEAIKNKRKEAAYKEDEKWFKNFKKGKVQDKESIAQRKEKYTKLITKQLQRSLENES